MDLIATPRPNRSLEQTLAVVYEYTGTRLSESGAFAEALARYGKSLAISERQLAADPDYTTAQIQVMVDYRGLALTRARQGNRAETLTQMRQALERARSLNALSAKRPEFQDPHAPPEQRRTDWNLAREAYARSLELWRATDESTPRRHLRDRPEAGLDLTDRYTALKLSVRLRARRLTRRAGAVRATPGW